MIRARHTLPVVGVTCAAGLTAVSLASGANERRPPVRYASPVPFGVAGCLPSPAAIVRLNPRNGKLIRPAAPAAPATAAKPVPSDRLLDAFSVLRRPRTAGDTLPKAALERLRVTGAEFDATRARLIRTTPRGGQAWLVPVADIRAVDCGGVAPASVLYDVRALRARSKVLQRFLRTAPARSGAPAVRRLRPLAVPALPAAPVAGGSPALTVPAKPLPSRLRGGSAAKRLRAARAAIAATDKPLEGAVVVALGDAPSGGGGSVADLLRARARPTVEGCSGPGGRLVAISGLAPDGVREAFLTAPDGTAIKTTVQNNAYAFIVPPARTVRERYVTWTKGGLPQVTAVDTVPAITGGVRCPAAVAKLPRVSPAAGGFDSVVYANGSTMRLLPALRAVRPGPGRVLPVPQAYPTRPPVLKAPAPRPPVTTRPVPATPAPAPRPAAPAPRPATPATPAPARPAAPVPARPPAPAAAPSRPSAPAPVPARPKAP
ncbi:hypothetical protein DSM112329_02656 [Paraconexibacter sp. AEG42_29]|uniref:Uncharacterized protein n=1 Tax=Paraconexibacter sp. AEG42_29 TaxID=2997339 RepID=A0AAU7AW28_9ACTN